MFVRLDEDDVFPSTITGLIAMALMQKYKRPTVVARLGADGKIKGSMRSPSNTGLESFKRYLDSTGLCEYVQGHDLAAGLCIPSAALSSLHEMANEQLSIYNFTDSCYDADFERVAGAADIEQLIYDISGAKHIWAQSNSEPLIFVKDICITKSDMQIMGKAKNTLKFVKNGVAYMKFFATNLINELTEIFDSGEEVKIEIIGKANLNTWRGTTTPQIFIESYEIKKSNIFDF